MEGFEVDCRIRDSDGYRGTVRYIGPVAAAKSKEEIWLGVEWDKQGRGKHDGSFSVGLLHVCLLAEPQTRTYLFL